MNDPGRMEQLHRSRQSMWRMRWVLVGLSAVLAVVLIASGAVVIGVIIGVMAGVRAVMIFRWQRPGAQFGRGPRGSAPGS
jgi:hypothetical protein